MENGTRQHQLQIDSVSSFNSRDKLTTLNDIVETLVANVLAATRAFCKEIGVRGGLKVAFFAIWRVLYFVLLRRNLKNVNLATYKLLKQRLFGN